MSWIDPKTIYTILHLLGVALGAGGAFMSDVLFLMTTKDRNLDQSEFKILQIGSVVTWAGLGLLIISGVLLFTTNPAGYLESSKFITKMIIVGILTVNGIVFHVLHLPHLRQAIGQKLSTSEVFRKSSAVMYTSGAISVVSWVTALVLGGLRMIPISVPVALGIYGILVIIAMVVSELKRRRYLRE
jgi:hypothetical protein